jgi:hypothetical protein
MAMVKFATLCDVQIRRVGIVATLCHRRSDEYQAWPACRSCGEHVCDRHEPDGTRHEDDSDNDEGVAEMRISVLCPRCLEDDGPDEYCVAPEEQDEAQARAEREYRDLDRGEL